MTDPRRAQELFNRSVALAQREDFEGAIKVLNEVIDSLPIGVAYRNRALCRKELISSGKNSPSEQQIRQWLFQMIDDFTKAVEDYKGLPSDAYRKIGGDEVVSECYAERGETKMLLATTYNGTQTKIDGIKNVDTDNKDEFRKWLVDVMGENGRNNEDIGLLREAVNDANEAIRYDRNNIQAYRIKAFIYDTHFDDPKTAAEQYSRAIDVNASPFDYFNRAWCYYQIGNKRDAYSDCKRAITLDSDITGFQPVSARRGKYDLWKDFWRDCIS
jgi:tetratricopeptide (TPR) repeat protein